jgi:hypothetical protein
MKGVLLILLFTGEMTTHSFTYTPWDWDGDGKISATEQVLSCSETAEQLYEELADHHWHVEGDPKRQGYYLKSGKGTIQGHIC